MTRKRKLFSPVHRFILVLALLVFFFCLVLGLFLENRKTVIQSLEERLSVLTETTAPLKFMVLSREQGTISARFRFYDTGGKELASFEQSWPGGELTLDSIIIPAGTRFLAFPCRIFTDAVAPGEGTVIFDFYDRDGFPAIYDDPSLDETLRHDLEVFFARARTAADYSDDSEPEPGVYGNAVHDLQHLARFEPGVIYTLEYHASGAVEIRE
ncbi:MAG: hypothetical protein LBI85_02540 [Spirochaetaceae bacterium]|jgi:hypothetical protein|nr:hypothetical protein [Spirochaetaceae bacterium]